MRDLIAVVALAVAMTGCVSSPPAPVVGYAAVGHPALDRAEVMVARGDFAGALAAYDEFLGRHPDHARARAARDTVAQVLVTQAEVTRLREELTRSRDELTKTRQELQARQAEAERLRGDLERLKQIDIKPERKRP